MEDKKKETNLKGVTIFFDDIDITLQEGNPNGILLSDDGFVKMMGIAKKTAQRWRKDGKIGYVKLNRKIYYTMKEVERFLKRNEIRNSLQGNN